MARFFNEALVEKTAHMAVSDGKKVFHLPVVRGVVHIPDDLMRFAHLHAAWVPFRGQVQDVSDEQLKPIGNVDKHYKDAAK